MVEPYFNRAWNHFSSHAQTPYNKLSRFPAATLRGKVAYISFPIFTAFSRHGNYPYRLLVANLLDLLLPQRLLRVDGPTSMETSIMQQGRRTIVHLLQYCPERRAEGLDILEDIVPLYDIGLSLRLPRRPKKVYLAPDLTPVDFSYLDGRCELMVPEINGHAMLVFE